MQFCQKKRLISLRYTLRYEYQNASFFLIKELYSFFIFQCVRQVRDSPILRLLLITIFACGHTNAPTPEQGLILFRRSLMFIRAFIRPVWAGLLSASVALGSETGICWVAQKNCINIVPQTLDQSIPWRFRFSDIVGSHQ